MAQYTLQGNRLDIIPDGSMDVYQKFPVGTYFVRFAPPPESKFYLEKSVDFVHNEIVYGDIETRSDRIITTFMTRNTNTGILLSGIKGSGKTFLAKHVASRLAKEHGIATVVVSDLFDTNALSMFLKNITEPVVILFEEFEKIYKTVKSDEDDGPRFIASGDKSAFDYQEGLLTLLDGVFVSKKLFIFTCNETWRINDLLMNRPGRVFYHFKYHGVEQDVVESYCKANLNDEKKCAQVMEISEYLDDQFTFDMLQALVEECNRYNEAPFEAIQYMNVEPDTLASYYMTAVRSLEGDILGQGFTDTDVHLDNYFDPTFYVRIRFYALCYNPKEVNKYRKMAIEEEQGHYGGPEEKTAIDTDFESSGMGFTSGETQVKVNLYLTNKHLKDKRRGVLIFEKNNIEVTLTRKKLDSSWRYLKKS